MISEDEELRVPLYEWDELVNLVVTPDTHACLFIDEDAPEAVRFSLAHRPGLSPDVLDMFAPDVVQRLRRFLEHGPEPDGWHRRRIDGVWQLWIRLVELPCPD